MNKLRNIIITGSNKGVGFGVVQNLVQKQGWNVIMACRNLELANKSKDQLMNRFPKASINVEQLDVTKEESINSFVEVVAEKYQKIDVLLNNAGMIAKGDAFKPEFIEPTFNTNFYGPINLTQKILKHISDQGKVLFVGAMIGKLNKIKNVQLKNRFRNPELTKKKLQQLISEFIEGVKEGNCVQKGWPKSIYGISKVGINHYARVLSRYEEVINRKIQVNAVCPGYVKTDMSGHKGVLTIQQGALTPLYAIELPFQVNPQLQGKFIEKSSLSSLE